MMPKIFIQHSLSISLIMLSSLCSALPLFGEAEAEKLRMNDHEWEAIANEAPTRGFTIEAGPVITFEAPRPTDDDQLRLSSPANLSISFNQRETKVDMSSLDIEIEKGWFSISITDKLTPFIKGNRISANDIEIPEGKYKILITVRDLAGNEAKREYRLRVKNPSPHEN